MQNYERNEWERGTKDRRLVRLLLDICLVCSFMLLAAPSVAQNGSEVSVAKFYGDRNAAVSYTFDDGLLEQYTELFPVLRELGIKCSFCVNGNTINNAKPGDEKPRMTWEMMREMAEDGQEITSHGWAHTNITTLEGEALRYEVEHNDTVIFEKTGHFPRTYFYPGNSKSKEGVAFASRNRVGTRTYQVSIGSKRSPEWLHDWLRQLINNGEWGVGMTHGISRGYDHFSDPNILFDHLRDASKLQDSLWIGTFEDVSAYVKERDSLKIDIKKKKGVLEVYPSLGLDKEIFRMPITLILPPDAESVRQDGKSLTIKNHQGKKLADIDPFGGKITIKRGKKAANVYLYAGQSNTDGRAFVKDMPDYLRNGYEHLNFANVTQRSNGRFGERIFEEDKGRFAFCDVTNYYLDKSLERDFYSVKCAYGGTSIDTAATYPNRPVWFADSLWIDSQQALRDGKGMSLTKSLTEGLRDLADSTLNYIEAGYDVKAIMWHQGESDRKKAANYYDNLRTMITYMRLAIYEITGDEEDKTLPFLIGTVNPKSKQYSRQVEEAKERVAADLPNVYIIDINDGSLGSDNLHFDSKGTEELGKRMFAKLSDLGLAK